VDRVKELSTDDWRAALTIRQMGELEKALSSGDLDRQRKVIDLKKLLRLEGASELIAYLAKKIVTRRLDEKFVRDQLIQWEMASLLLNWKK